jgi:hypothetical protein
MSRQGQLAAEPRRPPSGPAPIDQRGDQLFGRALDAGRSSARARLDSSRNAANTMLTAVELLLNDSYNILILLDRARRARRKPTVLFEVLCEWAASIGPATISSPFSGAGALRVVYAPEKMIKMTQSCQRRPLYRFPDGGSRIRIRRGSPSLAGDSFQYVE